MTTTSAPDAYSIKEAAALTGLPASTLRYYESIGVIAPVRRGATSGHRIYDEADLHQLLGIACLAATGMSVADMRTYVGNGTLGPTAAAAQIELLTAQQHRLVVEAEQLVLRQQYVALKVAYWHAVQDGDTDRATGLAAQACGLADALKQNH